MLVNHYYKKRSYWAESFMLGLFIGCCFSLGPASPAWAPGSIIFGQGLMTQTWQLILKEIIMAIFLRIRLCARPQLKRLIEFL